MLLFYFCFQTKWEKTESSNSLMKNNCSQFWEAGGCQKLGSCKVTSIHWFSVVEEKRSIRRKNHPKESRAEQGQKRGDKRRGRMLPLVRFPLRAEMRRGPAPLIDLKMSCFASPLLSLFLQEATSRWAPKPWQAWDIQIWYWCVLSTDVWYNNG